MLRFLAGGVEDRADVLREVRGGLEEQRRLADARLAAEQDERSRDDAAAKDTVEFADPARDALGLRRLDVRVTLRPLRRRSRQRVAMALVERRRRVRRALFDERVPRAAVDTAPLPLRRLR